MNSVTQGGALQSPDDSDDCIYEHLAYGPPGYYSCEQPEEYDMRERAQPIRDQIGRGTCAAFAGSAIKEVQENSDCGFDEWMSPEFIYHHRANKPSSGMYGRNVFQILQSIGSVPESAYPYRDDETAPAPDNELYKLAAQYKISNYARVTTTDGLKRALLELGPCYLQLPLYSTRPHFWRPSENEHSEGWHAVAVIGYTKNGFILRNSWGPKWNGDGCVEFPYEDWTDKLECWASVDEPTPAKAQKKRRSEICTLI